MSGMVVSKMSVKTNSMSRSILEVSYRCTWVRKDQQHVNQPSPRAAGLHSENNRDGLAKWPHLVQVVAQEPEGYTAVEEGGCVHEEVGQGPLGKLVLCCRLPRQREEKCPLPATSGMRSLTRGYIFLQVCASSSML